MWSVKFKLICLEKCSAATARPRTIFRGKVTRRGHLETRDARAPGLPSTPSRKKPDISEGQDLPQLLGDGALELPPGSRSLQAAWGSAEAEGALPLAQSGATRAAATSPASVGASFGVSEQKLQAHREDAMPADGAGR